MIRRLFSYEKLRFLLVGGSVAILYMGLIFVLRRACGWNENPSIAVSYFVAVTVHFLANKFFVYQSQGIHLIRGELLRYAFLTLFNYGITAAVTNLAMYFKQNLYAAVVVSILLSVVLGYLIMKYLVFTGGRKTDA